MRVGRSPFVALPVATEEQRRWLRAGLDQPGGKLPLRDDVGQLISRGLIATCLHAGWIEPWVPCPTLAQVRVCRLTKAGKAAVERDAVIRVDFTQWKRDTSAAGSHFEPSSSHVSPLPTERRPSSSSW